MKLEQLNEYLQTLATLGAIAGLLAIGYELRQNTQAIAQEAAATYAATANDLFLFAAGDEKFSSIMATSIYGRDVNPDEVDQFRLELFYRSIFRNWQDTHYRYNSGVLDEALWEAQVRFMEGVLRGDPGLISYWNFESDGYTDEFQTFMTAMKARISDS